MSTIEVSIQINRLLSQFKKAMAASYQNSCYNRRIIRKLSCTWENRKAVNFWKPLKRDARTWKASDGAVSGTEYTAYKTLGGIFFRVHGCRPE